mmetsp:Transcript_25722/g.101429  ORF Transcript_25722/g.101429 Transcript_25722/m.101429 type:complete len:566 (-) Transcript_25722:1720-3417(-)
MSNSDELYLREFESDDDFDVDDMPEDGDVSDLQFFNIVHDEEEEEYEYSGTGEEALPSGRLKRHRSGDWSSSEGHRVSASAEGGVEESDDSTEIHLAIQEELEREKAIQLSKAVDDGRLGPPSRQRSRTSLAKPSGFERPSFAGVDSGADMQSVAEKALIENRNLQSVLRDRLESLRQKVTRVSSFLAAVRESHFQLLHSSNLENSSTKKERGNHILAASGFFPSQRWYLRPFGTSYFALPPLKKDGWNVRTPWTSTAWQKPSSAQQQLVSKWRKWTVQEKRALATMVVQETRRIRCREVMRRAQVEGGTSHAQYVQEEFSRIRNAAPETVAEDAKDWDLKMWKSALDHAQLPELQVRTPADCRCVFANQIAPWVKRDSWTEEEDAQLMSLVRASPTRPWVSTASMLGNGRTALQCLRRAKQLSDSTSERAEWSKSDDLKLSEAVKKHADGDWRAISNAITGKSPQQCLYRWTRVGLLRSYLVRGMDLRLTQFYPCRSFSQVINPSIRKGRWTGEEDALLRSAVSKRKPGEWYCRKPIHARKTQDSSLMPPATSLQKLEQDSHST